MKHFGFMKHLILFVGGYAVFGICFVLFLLLTSCVPVKTKLPTTVQVQVDHYIAVPAELTKACPIAVLATMTNGELARVERDMKASLQRCNVQLDAIRKLGQP